MHGDKKKLDDNSAPMVVNYWVARELKGIDLKAVSYMSTDLQIVYKEIPGTPLKVEINTGDRVITFECTDLTNEKLPASTFELPAGYLETES